MPKAGALRKQRQLNAASRHTARTDRHPKRRGASRSDRPTNEPGTPQTATQPRSETGASSRDALRRAKPRRHGDTGNRQREPTEDARPPERTNHGQSRGKRGTSRRGTTDHETKIQKTRTPQQHPNPKKSRPNPEKSRPNPKKEHPKTHKTNAKGQAHPARTRAESTPPRC